MIALNHPDRKGSINLRPYLGSVEEAWKPLMEAPFQWTDPVPSRFLPPCHRDSFLRRAHYLETASGSFCIVSMTARQGEGPRAFTTGGGAWTRPPLSARNKALLARTWKSSRLEPSSLFSLNAIIYLASLPFSIRSHYSFRFCLCPLILTIERRRSIHRGGGKILVNLFVWCTIPFKAFLR